MKAYVKLALRYLNILDSVQLSQLQRAAFLEILSGFVHLIDGDGDVAIPAPIEDNEPTKENTMLQPNQIIKKLLSGSVGSGLGLTCPICDDEYNHQETPYEIYGYENIKNPDPKWSGRGNCLVIPFWCENGHKWELLIGQHKGNTFISVHNKTDAK